MRYAAREGPGLLALYPDGEALVCAVSVDRPVEIMKCRRLVQRGALAAEAYGLLDRLV